MPNDIITVTREDIIAPSPENSEIRYTYNLNQVYVGPAGMAYRSSPIKKERQDRLIKGLLDAGENDNPARLEKEGRALYRVIVPREVRDYLSRSGANVVVQAEFSDVPWELLHDGSSFLGSHRAVGRRVTLEYARPEIMIENLPLPVTTPEVLIIANPTGDAPGTVQIANRLATMLKTAPGAKGGCRPRILTGPEASYTEVTGGIEDGYRIIHFGCHGRLNGQTSRLVLADDILSTNDISEALRQSPDRHPFVFLGACLTDRADGNQDAWRRQVGLADSVAGAFTKAGAAAVVATLFEIKDASAAVFAEMFYGHLLHGLAVGEALRRAKADFREGNPGDTTWAAYVLYGDPTWQIFENLYRSQFKPHTRVEVDAEAAKWKDSRGGQRTEIHDLLAALFSLPDSLAIRALGEDNKSPQAVAEDISESAKQLSEQSSSTSGDSGGISGDANRLRGRALKLARALGQELLDMHLFLAAIHPDHRNDPACKILAEASNVTPELLWSEAARTLEENDYKIDALESIDWGEKPINRAATRVREPKERAEGKPAPKPESSATEPTGKQGGPSFGIQAERQKTIEQALKGAREWAERTGWEEEVTATHLFLALTEKAAGRTQALLIEFHIQPVTIRLKLRERIDRATKRYKRDEYSTGSSAIDILNEARRLARKETADGPGEIHLLRAILSEPGTVLEEEMLMLDVDAAQLLSRAEGLPLPPRRSAPQKSRTPTLEQLGRDLVEEARQGRLSPVIGRDREIEEAMYLLLRRHRSNPILIGEAGVGKTAVVEGLAQRIASGTVPDKLQGTRIFDVPVSGLVAGTEFRGTFESRVQSLIEEAEHAGDVILFFDEIHTLLGAGETMGSSLDAANILKPALARGKIRCIGATTTGEYNRYISRDPAFERRFQAIQIGEPSVDDAIIMAQGFADYIGKDMEVSFAPGTPESAVRLSVEHLINRVLPDKAMSVLETCASRAATRHDRLSSSSAEVTAQEVVQVVSEMAGVPIGSLAKEQKALLRSLEKELSNRIVGQEQAINTVAKRVRWGHSELRQAGHPRSVMMFLGPSGVGKTALARSLADALWPGRPSILILDMSEYSDSQAIARLLGAAPGYAGLESEGRLTGWLRRHPYSIILMDEIEKAHPSVFDLCLQLFSDGRISDSQNRRADARHAIFIMTSNLAAGLFSHSATIGLRAHAEPKLVQDRVLDELRNTFRKEFLNRIDEFVLFPSLLEENAISIVQKHLAELEEQAHSSWNLRLRLNRDEVAAEVVRQGFNVQQGARGLYRAFERLVAEPINEARSTLDETAAELALTVSAEGTVLVEEPASPGSEKK
jgi:ATP-dependent Clp protease ATP-binding subunit ClpA